MKSSMLVLSFFLIITFYSCAAKKAVPEFLGKVTLTVGDVRIDGVPAKADAAVLSNSTIVTGKDSYCEFIFNEKNIIRVLENSSITLDMQNLRKVLKIQSGGLETVVKKLSRSKDSGAAPFEVQTATAVASVRGTSFYVRVLDASNSAVCACNGVVTLGNPGQTNLQTVESSHHSGFVFTSSTNGLSYHPVKFAFKDDAELKKLAGHNDEEMQNLAGKIGVQIDWTKPDKEIE